MTESIVRPLQGKTIVVTRARAQAGEFSDLLRASGASVVEFPTIRIADAPDPDALRRAASRLSTYDWVVFTSVNGVERFWTALRSSATEIENSAVRVCAIGPATASALARRGIRADVVPGEFVAEATVEALARSVDLRGVRVLLPRAEIARAALPDGLRARGALVDEVAAYATELDGADTGEMRKRVLGAELDMITFTASSCVRNYVELLGTDTGGARVASIGPITSGTARELGLPVHVEATDYTIPGLHDAIVTHYAGPQEQ